LTVVCRSASLVIAAVVSFMQDAEKALVEMVGMIAGGEPAIPGADAAAKRVGGDIEPAGMEVEANGGRRRLPENLLARDRVLPFQNALARLLAGAGNDGHQRCQVRTQVGKDAGDLSRGCARLAFIQERIRMD